MQKQANPFVLRSRRRGWFTPRSQSGRASVLCTASVHKLPSGPSYEDRADLSSDGDSFDSFRPGQGRGGGLIQDGLIAACRDLALVQTIMVDYPPLSGGLPFSLSRAWRRLTSAAKASARWRS